MTTQLQLGDETRLRMPNPFQRLNLNALAQARVAPASAVAGDEYRGVPLDAITAEGPMQVRAAFDPNGDDEDRALVESLARDGQRLPVVLAQVEGEAGLLVPLDGHRRIAALRHLGHPSVKAILLRAGTLDCDLISLTANVRKNLAPLEQARAIQRLEQRHGLSVDEIAEHVGLARSRIYDLRRLIGAHPDIVAAVEAGRISAKSALAMLSAPKEQHLPLLKLASECHLSEPQVRRVLDTMAKEQLTPEQAAVKWRHLPPPEGYTTPTTSRKQPRESGAVPRQAEREPTIPAGGETREALAAYVHKVFPEIAEANAQQLATLAAEHGQPRKVVHGACLLLLSKWDVEDALEGAELAQRDPHVRHILGMLEACTSLVELVQQQPASRECAPMLGGLIQHLVAAKRRVLKLKDD